MQTGEQDAGRVKKEQQVKFAISLAVKREEASKLSPFDKQLLSEQPYADFCKNPENIKLPTENAHELAYAMAVCLSEGWQPAQVTEDQMMKAVWRGVNHAAGGLSERDRHELLMEAYGEFRKTPANFQLPARQAE